MVNVSYYRDRADHLRQLADLTWQHDLDMALRSLAQNYDETAEDLEIGDHLLQSAPAHVSVRVLTLFQ